jgi:hypothetical protein
MYFAAEKIPFNLSEFAKEEAAVTQQMSPADTIASADSQSQKQSET